MTERAHLGVYTEEQPRVLREAVIPCRSEGHTIRVRMVYGCHRGSARPSAEVSFARVEDAAHLFGGAKQEKGRVTWQTEVMHGASLPPVFGDAAGRSHVMHSGLV